MHSFTSGEKVVLISVDYDEVQSWTKGCRQIHETKILCDFLTKVVKIWHWGGQLGTHHHIKAFQEFS